LQKNAAELVAILDELFATRPRDEWLRIFGEFDLFCCAVHKLTDLAEDPQILANDYLIDFEHPTLGTVKIPGYPIHFSESWAQTTRAAPDLGEHTEEILAEIAEFSAEDIARLRKQGIV
jgi:crotonobetainyl-CoA:carnitine CoA-transferase CaiB-like acyl-CoA transferase